VIGEAHEVPADLTFARFHIHVIATLHVWMREPGLSGVKEIAGAIRRALRDGFVDLDDGYHCIDLHYGDARFLRDKDGATSHGVVTIKALLEEQS
jgi:hypothetical protein